MAITDEIPKSRITLTYRTNVNGQPEDVTLPFRVLVMGDLSGGTSKDQARELDKRQIRRLDGRNLNQVIHDMGISLRMDVGNHINPAQSERIEVNLPITSVKSFQPAQVAQHVPQIKALLLHKKLLLEVQANFDNNKAFRTLLREAMQAEGMVEALRKQLPSFEMYKLPIATLTIDVPADIAALPGLEIRKDNQIVEKKQWNTVLRTKPGDCVVTAFVPGKQTWKTKVNIAHNAKHTIKVGPLLDPGAAGAASPADTTGETN